MFATYSADTVLVLDDILLSAKCNRPWEDNIATIPSESNLSITGGVFFKEELSKENFILHF